MAFVAHWPHCVWVDQSGLLSKLGILVEGKLNREHQSGGRGHKYTSIVKTDLGV